MRKPHFLIPIQSYFHFCFQELGFIYCSYINRKFKVDQSKFSVANQNTGRTMQLFHDTKEMESDQCNHVDKTVPSAFRYWVHCHTRKNFEKQYYKRGIEVNTAGSNNWIAFLYICVLEIQILVSKTWTLNKGYLFFTIQIFVLCSRAMTVFFKIQIYRQTRLFSLISNQQKHLRSTRTKIYSKIY